VVNYSFTSVFSLPRRIIITIDITVVAVSSFVSRVRVKVSVIYGDYNTLNFSSGETETYCVDPCRMFLQFQMDYTFWMIFVESVNCIMYRDG